MNLTKDAVKAWLDEHHRGREWLADKCGVSKKTVNNWLSSPADIPAKALLIIENLMQIDEAKANAAAAVPQNLVLEFTHEEFDTICAAAAGNGQIPRKWAQDTHNSIAAADVVKIAEELQGKAAG